MTIALLLAAASVAADPLADARRHLNHGRYAEALDAYAEVSDSTAAALGKSRVFVETGRYRDALTLLDAAIQASPKDADLLARRGETRLLVGDVAGADADAEAALAVAPDHLVARWVKAETLTETGRIAEATEACRWFVRYYNRAQPTDADSLVYVARGSLRYARWKRVSAIFRFAVNELCRDIAKADADDWRADAISGALLLEKYNEAQGLPDLKRALAKNPQAAEVRLALGGAAFDDYDHGKAAEEADAALEVNPSLVPALGLKADLAIAERDLAAARRWLDKAAAVNPHDQGVLGRRVALAVLAGDADAAAVASLVAAVEKGDPAAVDASAPYGPAVAELLRRNPKPGAFLAQLGETLESRRLYVEAERAYAAAVAVMPELSEPQVALALLAMRAGDVAKAGPALDAAFASDPFHVRVSNMRKVVGLLGDYESIETPHFVVRFDPAKDRVLAELAAAFLEDCYGEVTTEFGYEPPAKTVVELFNGGRGQSAHQWFAARMIGLPWVQTIGASTGQMVAVASPTAGMSYHWGRVLRHEFVHVVTLQQTGFRIPHWYTEALAVRSEGFPRPQEWDDLLRERVPAGELRTLDALDAAFIRPDTADDWQFAYCQSLLYADYLDATFGRDVHRKLLAAYADGLPTTQAIESVTGRSAAEFESGYREFLSKLVAGLGAASEDDGELEPDARAALAEARSGKRADAIARLEKVLDRDAPASATLALLGKLKLLDGDATGAATLFRLGRERFPQDRQWLKLHAAALLKAEDGAALQPILEELTTLEADESLAPKKLAELAAAAGDAAAAKRWAERALFVTPNDADLHRLLADACETLDETDRAATARRHAGLLEKVEPSGDD